MQESSLPVPEPSSVHSSTVAQNLGITFRMCRTVVGRMLEQAAGESGVRGAILAPAMVRTPASERAGGDPELREFIRKKQPLADGMVDPEDVAHTALFLLGDTARAITGQVVTVDGGWNVT